MHTIESLSEASHARSPKPPDRGSLPHRSEDTKNAGVLVAIDDTRIAALTEAYLRNDGFHRSWSTDSTPEALRISVRVKPSLILLGIQTTDLHGLGVLQSLRDHPATAATPIVAMVGNVTREQKFDVLKQGATDLLTLPLHQAELVSRARNVLSAKIYADQLSRYTQDLENAVRERTQELELARRELIQCMARAAELRDDDTGSHIIRVGRYARIIGEELGLSNRALEILEPAAQLHDIGKIGIPDRVLLKPGRLTGRERAIVRKHCSFGKRIIEGKSLQELSEREVVSIRNRAMLDARIRDIGQSPLLCVAKRIALTHHEHWDGTGYPVGLAGLDIPLEGRITAVADVFDALSSKRRYKPAYPLDQCFRILEEGRGSRFDPSVVDAFLVRRVDVIRTRIDFADVD